MLKIIISRIVRKHGGAGIKLSPLKLYGLKIYSKYINEFVLYKDFSKILTHNISDNEAIVYELSVAFQGLYVFREVLRSKLPTNKVELGLISRSIPVLLKFRVCSFP